MIEFFGTAILYIIWCMASLFGVCIIWVLLEWVNVIIKKVIELIKRIK